MEVASGMSIDEKILNSYGGESKLYKTSELIFSEGDMPLYYFQIIKGIVKLNNYNEEGKEFIHNILNEEQSFGEALIFLDKAYPINAETLVATEVMRVPKSNFLEMMNDHPSISTQMNYSFSQQIYFKLIMIQHIASHNPMVRIKALIDYLKSSQQEVDAFAFQIPLTRQQIADFTGLRVETVIRTLKKMENSNLLKIENRKILY
ncbi:Crp/Fnr family transcriptional regulator [Chryseobacterium sp. CT-SW4]|uniref:Crp/Fnr family transcriptional regulator n=1 Tax=Chryseobacterium sp. SW-1 TaxID=3157343 RepID=UPI003B01B626